MGEGTVTSKVVLDGGSLEMFSSYFCRTKEKSWHPLLADAHTSSRVPNSKVQRLDIPYFLRVISPGFHPALLIEIDHIVDKCSAFSAQKRLRMVVYLGDCTTLMIANVYTETFRK